MDPQKIPVQVYKLIPCGGDAELNNTRKPIMYSGRALIDRALSYNYPIWIAKSI